MKRIVYSILCLLPLFVSAQAIEDTSGVVSSSAEDSSSTKVIRLKINSNKSDFSPYVFKDQLMFVSGRPKDVGVQYVDVNDESEITDIFTCTSITPTKFKNVNSFNAVINTNYYEGPFCLNKQGNILYYTANDKKSSLLKIYRSVRTYNIWSKPELMPFCLPEYSYCHPALSPNEDFMIFSTNMNKEKNGMDLYRSKFNEGVWETAESLGDKINDNANQVFPFISPANKLYFASDKKGGMGGLDIYAILLGSDSSVVRPLATPINSTADDFGIWVDSTSEAGYFSSSRAKRSKDDIFYFSKSVPDFSDAKTVAFKPKYCFTFFEESTLSTKDTLNLTSEWSFGDGERSKGLKARHCYKGPGNYKVQLNIVDKVSGEIFTSEAEYELAVERPDKLEIECNDTLYTLHEMIFNSHNCFLKGFELSKIYWSFGDGKFSTGPVVKHKYIKEGKYTIEMDVIAKNLASGKTEQFKAEKIIVAADKIYYHEK